MERKRKGKIKGRGERKGTGWRRKKREKEGEEGLASVRKKILVTALTCGTR